MSVRLGEILVKENLITTEQLKKALEHQRHNGGKLGSVLMKLGYITDDQITGVLSRQYGVPSINLKYYEVDQNVIKLIPQDTAVRYQIVPLSRVGSTLTIAMTDPTNVFAMDDIKFMTGFNVEPVVASESAIGDAITRFYGGTSKNQKKINKLLKELVDEEKKLERAAEKTKKERDTRKKKELDFRVSTVPTLYGEKVVMRLLDKENLRLDMTKLGFEPESLKKFERNILKPYGMVLVTGPTGSGKTNTLYSSVATLNTVDTNIMTAEDPVEFQLAGINQVQMKEQIGLNFAAALRAFLRQDPNIILVGEIRDFETAEIAVKAALTGHLVLSTLHTNDAPSTISRLMNMGIEPFLVATSVNLICAQRLVRRICTNCKEPLGIPQQALLDGGFTPEEAKATTIYHGRGCGPCNKSGYKGRVGLYEVMEINDELRELILVGASAVELKKKALDQGMITLRRSGLIKAAAGLTTLEEVLRESVL